MLDLDQAIEFMEYLSERSAARTAQAYSSDVARFVAYCESVYGEDLHLAMLNRSDLHDYGQYCRQTQQISAATWNRYVASLKAFSQWLKQKGQIDYDPTDMLDQADAQALAPKSLKESEYRRFRLVTMKAVMAARTPSARLLALRNQAVIVLMLDAGLREGEVVNLRQSNLLLGQRKGRVFVCGAKGNKDRIVPLDKDSVDKLADYLEARGDVDLLFAGKQGETLKERGIQKLVRKLGEAAGIDVTPHMLRHTAAYRWLKAGASLGEVASLLGHSSLDVTRRYTLPHYEDLERIVEVA
jgi:site-specific recombinase XerD